MKHDAAKIHRVVVASLRCLADASHSPDWKQNGAGFYVVAGYVGRLDVWRSLEAAWRDALAEEQIRDFHATDCESGRREFGHLRGRQHEGERRRLQARFIGIIKSAPVWGLTAQVVLAPFWKYRLELLPYMAAHLRPLVTPPVFGGQAVVNMATQWIELRQLADDERIDYVFDENLEFQGRIEDLYSAV